MIQTIKMPIILLFAQKYEIKDEKSGEVNRGVTMNYYFNTNLAVEDNANGSKGTRPAKSSCDAAVFEKVKTAPAYYNADMEMTIGSDGKTVLKVIDLEYVSDIAIVPVDNNDASSTQEAQSSAPSGSSPAKDNKKAV